MEDQEGGVASPEEAPPLKRKAVGKRRLTVMIMGSVGRVRSFHISPRLFLWSIIFFIAYIVLSLFVLNNYIKLVRNSSQQQEQYTRLEEENATNKKVISKNRQQIDLLEGYIRHLEEGTEGFSGAGKKEPTRSEGEKTPFQTALPQKSNGAQTVDVTDMMIQKEGSSMSISLKLVNIQAGEGAVGGYMHLIAYDRKSATPKEWAYPQEKLEKGMPVNFKKGQMFLIQKFKQIQVRMNLGAASEYPSGIKVLVYDHSGEIILQKDMEVTRS